jgi:hypothetical protein
MVIMQSNKMIKYFLCFPKNQNIFFLMTVKVGLPIATATVLFIFLPDLFPFFRLQSCFKEYL